jgi:glycosyltransferase involved in cell wall biosynthesis
MHIPNGVPLPPVAAYEPGVREGARQRLGVSWAHIAVFVGRLSEEKNLSCLIDAWPMVLRRVPDAHLVLVGDGGTFRSVETPLRLQVERQGLGDRVHFAGRVTHVLEHLLAADLFVLPSLAEGMSNALLEAMAAGVAVVATSIPGNAQVIDPGHTGVLVPADCAEALAGAIVRVLADPAQAQRLGQAARRAVEERFAVPRVGEGYCALYEELVSGRGSAG